MKNSSTLLPCVGSGLMTILSIMAGIVWSTMVMGFLFLVFLWQYVQARRAASTDSKKPSSGID